MRATVLCILAFAGATCALQLPSILSPQPAINAGSSILGNIPGIKRGDDSSSSSSSSEEDKNTSDIANDLAERLVKDIENVVGAIGSVALLPQNIGSSVFDSVLTDIKNFLGDVLHPDSLNPDGPTVPELAVELTRSVVHEVEQMFGNIATAVINPVRFKAQMVQKIAGGIDKFLKNVQNQMSGDSSVEHRPHQRPQPADPQHRPSSTHRPRPTSKRPRPTHPSRPSSERPRPTHPSRPSSERPKPTHPSQPSSERPKPTPSVRPGPHHSHGPSSERPRPTSSDRPGPDHSHRPSSERPKPTSSDRPRPPSSERPKPTPSGRPSSERPRPTSSDRPGPDHSHRPSSERPKPTSSDRPRPPSSERPKPTPSGRPSSERPKPTSSDRPRPPSSERPKPTPSERPKPTPSGRPSSERPKPTSSDRPSSPKPTSARAISANGSVHVRVARDIELSLSGSVNFDQLIDDSKVRNLAKALTSVDFTQIVKALPKIPDLTPLNELVPLPGLASLTKRARNLVIHAIAAGASTIEEAVQTALDAAIRSVNPAEAIVNLVNIILQVYFFVAQNALGIPPVFAALLKEAATVVGSLVSSLLAALPGVVANGVRALLN